MAMSEMEDFERVRAEYERGKSGWRLKWNALSGW
jgi:hypothetical protein